MAYGGGNGVVAVGGGGIDRQTNERVHVLGGGGGRSLYSSCQRCWVLSGVGIGVWPMTNGGGTCLLTIGERAIGGRVVVAAIAAILLWQRWFVVVVDGRERKEIQMCARKKEDFQVRRKASLRP
jgi:hypothetical protein